MKKLIVSIMCIGFAISVHSEEIGKIVAKVNNEAVTARDLDEYYKIISYRMPEQFAGFSSDEAKGKREALDKLIEDKLILDEAKKQKIEISAMAISDQLNKVISSYPTREDFENSLIERGLNVTLLKERIRGQFLMRQVIGAYVNGYVNVTPQEVSNYYMEHKNELVAEQKYIIWIIQTKDKNILSSTVKALKEKGLAGEGNQSMHLVRVEAGTKDLKEEIAGMVKELKEGEHSVKKIGEEYYLVHLEKTLPPRELSLEEARENIFNIIWTKKFKVRFEEWIVQLKDSAVIKIYL
ncbi:MAG: SurA N-terminal domain-containing protein [Candidatus Omnitrophota bacterium]